MTRRSADEANAPSVRIAVEDGPSGPAAPDSADNAEVTAPPPFPRAVRRGGGGNTDGHAGGRGSKVGRGRGRPSASTSQSSSAASHKDVAIRKPTQPEDELFRAMARLKAQKSSASETTSSGWIAKVTVTKGGGKDGKDRTSSSFIAPNGGQTVSCARLATSQHAEASITRHA